MNERIKELAKQCYETGPIGKDGWPKFCKLNEEKFAELIILECEKVAKDPKWYGESPSNGWRNPIRHVCNVMKEHFGVEE